MTYALDTNCLVRWLLFDVADQAQRVEDVLNNSQNKLHVADATVIEISWVLSKVYEFDNIDVARFIRKVITHSNISCNAAFIGRVLTDYELSPKVSFADVYLAHSAARQDAKLLSFDKTLAKKLSKIVEAP